MRKSTKVIWVAGIVAVLIGTMAVGVYAQNGRLIRQRRALRQNALLRPQAWAAGLNLSQDQKEQLKSILAGHREELKNIAVQTAQARKEFAAALAQGADPQTLKAAYDKVSSAGFERVLLRSTISAQVKSILTPEQLQQLEKRKTIRENRVKKVIKKL